MSWLVYQAGGFLFGCTNNKVKPSAADAYTGAWQRDSEALGIRVPVAQAAATLGGIVLRFPPTPGTMGHIAICDGTGGTVEALGTAYGVVAGKVQGRRWDTGLLVSGITYGPPGPILPIAAPAGILVAEGAGQSKAEIMGVQAALAQAGFDPGPIDGLYGSKTAAAVAAFQATHGLVVDGEVGPMTRKALGI